MPQPKTLSLTAYDKNVLHEETALVVDPLAPEIQSLITQMFATMYKERGVGLSATQIGISLRIATIDADGKKFTIINPQIISRSRDCIQFTEGCLSIPGKEFPLIRNERIVVRYIDEAGKRCKIKLKGFLAIVFQHEIDHLDGILIDDRHRKYKDMIVDSH